jgi:hypothetical protein
VSVARMTRHCCDFRHAPEATFSTPSWAEGGSRPEAHEGAAARAPIRPRSGQRQPRRVRRCARTDARKAAVVCGRPDNRTRRDSRPSVRAQRVARVLEGVRRRLTSD